MDETGRGAAAVSPFVAARSVACATQDDFLVCVSRSRNPYEVVDEMNLQTTPMTIAGLAAFQGVPTGYGIVTLPSSS